MFLHMGKEYYPLEITAIKADNKKNIYDRSSRNKAYVYLAVDCQESKGEE